MRKTSSGSGGRKRVGAALQPDRRAKGEERSSLQLLLPAWFLVGTRVIASRQPTAQGKHTRYTRILGELKKLGIKVARSTVVNILKANGLDIGPKRGPGTWADFIARHAATLWASDFFSVRSLTMTGFVDLYVLFFIRIETRRVYIAGVTANPDDEWVTQQARNLSMHLDERGLEITHLVIDRDTKYTAQFDSILDSEGAKVVRVSRRAPNMNAHEERPHQSLNNEPLSWQDDEDGPAVLAFPAAGEVKCRERLDGLLKHYYCEAA